METRRAVGLMLLMLWAPSAWPADDPPDDEEDNPCRDVLPAASGSLDTMRAGLQWTVCSAAWVMDRMFGGKHQYAEFEDDTSGRAGFGLSWNEHDGTEFGGRFQANMKLPALNERFNATIGRANRDEYIADEVADIGPVGRSFYDDKPAEWFAGLGYSVRRERDNQFNLGAGVKLASPLNPFVNARYRHFSYPRDDISLTFGSTAFWENDEGFGLTQIFDSDFDLNRNYMLRLATSLRWSEETLGVRWRSRLALYQTIAHHRAMRYELNVRGETDGTEPDRYGLSVTHRRSIWRDWFFIEAGVNLIWTDGPLPADRCDACPGASIGFEFLFGGAYDRALRREAREAERAAREAEQAAAREAEQAAAREAEQAAREAEQAAREAEQAAAREAEQAAAREAEQAAAREAERAEEPR